MCRYPTCQGKWLDDRSTLSYPDRSGLSKLMACRETGDDELSDSHSKTCWCYIANQAYLLPTLVSASQLRSSLGDAGDPIKIVCVGEKTDIVLRSCEVAQSVGVEMTSVSESEIDNLPMTCARFFLNRLLGDVAGDVVYLDGDTQIVDGVDRLSRAAVPPDSIFAAPDIMSMLVDQRGHAAERRRGYFTSIGLNEDRQRHYFNAGIFKANLASWSDVSTECLRLLTADGGFERLRFLDQDAMNIVLAGSHTSISLSWNFPGFFINKGLEDLVKPSIVHYMSRPRPWDGPFGPWGREGFAPYVDFIARHPALRRLHRPFSGRRFARYLLQQEVKTLFERWGSRSMRHRIKAAEDRAFV